MSQEELRVTSNLVQRIIEIRKKVAGRGNAVLLYYDSCGRIRGM